MTLEVLAPNWRVGGQARGTGKNCSSSSVEAEFPLPLQISVCSPKSFNWLGLGETHPPCGGQSALLKICWSKNVNLIWKMLSEKHIESCLTRYLFAMSQPDWHKISHQGLNASLSVLLCHSLWLSLHLPQAFCEARLPQASRGKPRGAWRPAVDVPSAAACASWGCCPCWVSVSLLGSQGKERSRYWPN